MSGSGVACYFCSVGLLSSWPLLRRCGSGTSRVVIKCRGGTLAVRPQRGGLQGDSIGPVVFADVFHSLIEKTFSNMGSVHNNGLYARCPITGMKVDLSVSTSADDVSRRIVFWNGKEWVGKKGRQVRKWQSHLSAHLLN